MSVEQVGNAITFYAFYSASKVGKTGLSVTIDVGRRGLGAIKLVTGGSATELWGGLYYYTLTSGSVGSEDDYFAVFKTNDTTVDQKEIPALWVVGRGGVENLDATVSSRSMLTAQQVWEYGTRTLSSFGALVSDVASAVWVAATRTLSSFGFTPDANVVSVDGEAVESVDDFKAETSELATQADVTALQTHGDNTWATATGFATPANVPSVADVADAVWDEAVDDHVQVGTMGKKLHDSAASGDPWATDLSLAGYSGDQAGKYLADARNKALLITADNVHFTTPTDPITGDLILVRGDDYTSATGRPLPTWVSEDWTPFSLTTAQSVTFKALGRQRSTPFTKAMIVLADTQVQVEFTHEELAGFDIGRNAYRFEAEAVLEGGEVVTLARGNLSVVEDIP